MEASFFLSPLRDGRCGPMRGALPLGSRSADLAPTPRSGGAAPPRPHREGAPPHTPGVYAGLAAPAPTSGPTRPTPGVPFVSRRKEPKACQGRCPWTPLGGYYHPPSGGKRRSPPERGASSDGTQAINRLPRHGLTAGSVPLIEPKEKIRPICPLSLKWQIGLFFLLKVARRDA